MVFSAGLEFDDEFLQKNDQIAIRKQLCHDNVMKNKKKGALKGAPKIQHKFSALLLKTCHRQQEIWRLI